MYISCDQGRICDLFYQCRGRREGKNGAKTMNLRNNSVLVGARVRLQGWCHGGWLLKIQISKQLIKWLL